MTSPSLANLMEIFTSVVPEAEYEVRLRAFEGCCVSPKKPLKGPRPSLSKLIAGTHEKSVLPTRGHRFALPIFFLLTSTPKYFIAWDLPITKHGAKVDADSDEVTRFLSCLIAWDVSCHVFNILPSLSAIQPFIKILPLRSCCKSFRLILQFLLTWFWEMMEFWKPKGFFYQSLFTKPK